MSDKGFSLTVIFSGVSTHFRNGMVAGVRHRAVLPDASVFLADSISIDGYPDPFLYYLNPHFAQIEVQRSDSEIAQKPVDLTVDGLMTKNGYILSGVRLQVGNGIPKGVLGDPPPGSPVNVMSGLRMYYPNYEYSADVVTGGRAACYFDFDFGVATWMLPEPPQKPAWRFSITVETDGYPWLLVTPLNDAPGARPFTKLDLVKKPDGEASKHVTLLVNNLETAPEEGADQSSGDFDFLFHYLTARGGIPKRIIQPTPALLEPKSATADEMAAALKALAALLQKQAEDADNFYEQLRLSPDGMTPACSPAEFG
jgi:hypothetical protein